MLGLSPGLASGLGAKILNDIALMVFQDGPTQL